jgi:hypothetical protein
MWAHYAEQAKGFVVIFDRLDRVFKGDETGSLNVTKPVDYTEEFLGMTYSIRPPKIGSSSRNSKTGPTSVNGAS